ncbi:hypothetical protein MMIC_P2422 [Mariprofundus micogutta]|uniref:Resolvase HTH domain-containing protein n=1 Tax=Mariprofundus micogutta TaxID=1921010 RepID=A0A1L8CRA4_9PROT|nr:hypothetical protein [Mariprofundus micogutta]GAV21433.1 hypothetical protein MMIC_P2422 [Mariprofundus micogutta]
MAKAQRKILNIKNIAKKAVAKADSQPQGRPEGSKLDLYKDEIVKRLKMGVSISNIAGQCDVSRKAIYDFLKKQEIAPKTFNPKDYKITD